MLIAPAILGATETLSPMSIDAPFLPSLHAVPGMAGGARPMTMMFTITTRMRGGIG